MSTAFALSTSVHGFDVLAINDDGSMNQLGNYENAYDAWREAERLAKELAKRLKCKAHYKKLPDFAKFAFRVKTKKSAWVVG